MFGSFTSSLQKLLVLTREHLMPICKWGSIKRSELLKRLGFVFYISKLRLQSPFEVKIVQLCTTYDFGVPG